ncbi:hypothetical protein EJB05_49899, partial [Eragrostis curvula]
MRHDDLCDPALGSDELPPINPDANVGISRWRPCYALRLGEQVYRDFRWVDDERSWRKRSEVGVVIVSPKHVTVAVGDDVGELAVVPHGRRHRLLGELCAGQAGVAVTGGAADVVALPVVHVSELNVAYVVAGGRGSLRVGDGQLVGFAVEVQAERAQAHLAQAGNRARALDGAGVDVVRVDGAGGVVELEELLLGEAGADEAWQIGENHGSGQGTWEEGDGEQGQSRVEQRRGGDSGDAAAGGGAAGAAARCGDGVDGEGERLAGIRRAPLAAGPGKPAVDADGVAVHARDLDVAHVATRGHGGAPASRQDWLRPLDRAHHAVEVVVVVPAAAGVRAVEDRGEAVEVVGGAVLAQARVVQIGEGDAVVQVARARGAAGVGMTSR